MSINDYRVPNDPFVSTSTADVGDCDSSYGEGTKRKWNIRMYMHQNLHLMDL